MLSSAALKREKGGCPPDAPALGQPGGCEEAKVTRPRVKKRMRLLEHWGATALERDLIVERRGRGRAPWGWWYPAATHGPNDHKGKGPAGEEHNVLEASD